MKKARATKILCAVLTVIMVLGTGLSAMAAVTSTSVIKYDTANSAYSVTTNVSGLAENEMVTYLVHDADSMYNVGPTNIDYIDQKNADGTTASFNYKGTGNWLTKNEKIYVGAKSITAPVESTPDPMELGVAVYVNGVLLKDLTIEGKSAAGIKKIALDYAANVIDVRYNGEPVEFFNIEGAIGFNTDAALNDEDDTIAITTAAAKFVNDPTADNVLSSADIINMGLASAPADTANGGTALSYANGQVTSWNDIICNIANVDFSESLTAEDYWYANKTTFGELGYETVDVKFSSTKEPKNESYGPAISYEDIKAAYDSDKTKPVTVNVEKFVPQGITLHENGAAIPVEITVPAPGNYKLIARQNAYTADRMTAITYGDKSIGAASEQIDKYSFAKSADSIYLEAGTHTVTLNAVGSSLVRFDFLALVPATAASDDAYEAVLAAAKNDDEHANAFKEYLKEGYFTEGTAGIKLGTVKVEGNTLVAFGRAKGAYAECGILIVTDEGPQVFPALGVAATPGSANGGFAIELIDEDGKDLAEEFKGKYLYAYAIAEGQDYVEGITSEYEL